MADDDLLRHLKEAAETVAFTARAYSGWSHRIPGSVRTLIDPASAVAYVLAGGPGAPHAITFEAPHAPYWRHPVWGRGPRQTWRWAKQIPPRRFLAPALDAKADDVASTVLGTVYDWATRLGWEPR